MPLTLRQIDIARKLRKAKDLAPDPEVVAEDKVMELMAPALAAAGLHTDSGPAEGSQKPDEAPDRASKKEARARRPRAALVAQKLSTQPPPVCVQIKVG